MVETASVLLTPELAAKRDRLLDILRGLGRVAVAFSDGSSGGPWFYQYSSKQALGYLLGDTGGYQFGGNTDSPSYSPYWTSAFSSLVAYVAKKE